MPLSLGQECAGVSKCGVQPSGQLCCILRQENCSILGVGVAVVLYVRGVGITSKQGTPRVS